jgi:hypothetical protein
LVADASDATVTVTVAGTHALVHPVAEFLLRT